MQVTMRKVSDVKPYDKNPRRNDGAVDAVASSIREFGFQQPLVVDKDGVLIVGHTRLKAAKKLGLKEVPVVVADGLSPEQVKAYRLADNKTSDFSTWDNVLLLEELKDIAEFDDDYFTGFASSNFDMDGATAISEDGSSNKLDADEVGAAFEVRFKSYDRWKIDKITEAWEEMNASG